VHHGWVSWWMRLFDPIKGTYLIFVYVYEWPLDSGPNRIGLPSNAERWCNVVLHVSARYDFTDCGGRITGHLNVFKISWVAGRPHLWRDKLGIESREDLSNVDR
jgi:hypothetical protein